MVATEEIISPAAPRSGLISRPHLPVIPTFIDLFAGCGGLSLGLMQAGWRGLFAVEKDSHAFSTLKQNLIDGNSKFRYHWPEWLPKSPHRIGAFINKYRQQLASLNGSVDLVAGGPPCQGFSMAGRRKKTDARNTMFRHYVDMVDLIRPKFLLLENVKGIDVAFANGNKDEGGKRKRGRPPKPFSQRIKESLEKIEYHVIPGLVRAVDFGVPQMRPRFIMFAVAREYLAGIDVTLLRSEGGLNPFDILRQERGRFLRRKGLPIDKPVSVRDAISDLETMGKPLVDCVDSSGFRQALYREPLTHYQKLLHGSLNGTAPNSMRLANHRENTRERFQLILSTCRRGVSLSKADRERLGLKKQSTVPLDGDQPSHTLTTLPDDLLHYGEPRILTVREYGRLQSFPDWFEFRGNYTTGGARRVKQCPRYTQVGNAVPPFLAEALGVVLMALIQLCLFVKAIATGQFLLPT